MGSWASCFGAVEVLGCGFASMPLGAGICVSGILGWIRVQSIGVSCQGVCVCLGDGWAFGL